MSPATLRRWNACTISSRDASSCSRSVWLAAGLNVLERNDISSGTLRNVVNAKMSRKICQFIGCIFSVSAICNVDALISAAAKMS